MRPTQRLQQRCCGWAWQFADFSLPPPPSLQQWIISPAEWEGGEKESCRWFIQGSRLPRIVPSLTVPPRAHDPFQPDKLQPFYAVLVPHVTLEHFGEGEQLFLAFRSCGKSHVYVLCLQTCYIKKLVIRNVVACVLPAFFSKSCNLCRAFSHIIRTRFWYTRWLFCWELFKKLFDVGPSLHLIPCSSLWEF